MKLNIGDSYTKAIGYVYSRLFRIPYIYKDKLSNYIVDFEDINNKIIYEIKPNSTRMADKVKIKEMTAIEWAKNNGYVYEVVSDDWFELNAHKIDYNKHPQLKVFMKQFLK